MRNGMRNWNVMMLAASGLFFAACGKQEQKTSELQSNEVVKTYGPKIDGSYLWDGERVRYYAGSFKGNFNHGDCRQAAKKIYNLFKSRNQSVKYNASREKIRLANNYRYLVFGFVNESQNNGTWACVNVSSSGRDTYYYRADFTARNSSPGYVKKVYNVNGTRVGLGFADQDHLGDVHFYFNAR